MSGKKGEDIAVSYLKKQGYKIIERNYKTKLGEIDIIASDKGVVAFIEVRSNNSGKFGSPLETINRDKELKITRPALMYIKRHKLEDSPCRFDIVSVKAVDSVCPEIELIRDAFDLDSMYRY